MKLFLFKKTENKFIRIIKNIVFYSFIFAFICMFLMVALPSLKTFFSAFTTISAMLFCVGLCILVVCGVMWFVKEFWLELKENRNRNKYKKQQAILENALQTATFLFETEDYFYGRNDVCYYDKMEYFLTPDGKIISKTTSSWHDVHNVIRGSRYIFYRYKSFDEFNDIVNQHTDKNIKKYAGISETNYPDYIKSSL